MKAYVVVNKKGKIVSGLDDNNIFANADSSREVLPVFGRKKDALAERIEENGEEVVEVEIIIKGGKE